MAIGDEGSVMKAFLVVVGILTLAGTAGADYNECRQAYSDKQWDRAFEACHAQGRGTGRDYNEAMRWFLGDRK